MDIRTQKTRLIAAIVFLTIAMVFWTVMAIRYASWEILVVFVVGDVLVGAVEMWLLRRR